MSFYNFLETRRDVVMIAVRTMIRCFGVLLPIAVASSHFARDVAASNMLWPRSWVLVGVKEERSTYEAQTGIFSKIVMFPVKP